MKRRLETEEGVMTMVKRAKVVQSRGVKRTRDEHEEREEVKRVCIREAPGVVDVLQVDENYFDPDAAYDMRDVEAFVCETFVPRYIY
jgi:hypothetical protein